MVRVSAAELNREEDLASNILKAHPVEILASQLHRNDILFAVFCFDKSGGQRTVQISEVLIVVVEIFWARSAKSLPGSAKSEILSSDSLRK